MFTEMPCTPLCPGCVHECVGPDLFDFEEWLVHDGEVVLINAVRDGNALIQTTDAFL